MLRRPWASLLWSTGSVTWKVALLLWFTARLTFTPCASAGESFCFFGPVRLAVSGLAVGTGAGAGRSGSARSWSWSWSWSWSAVSGSRRY